MDDEEIRCPRCDDDKLSKNDVCNILVDYEVFESAVELALFNKEQIKTAFLLDTPEQKLKHIQDYYELLQDCKAEEEEYRDGSSTEAR